MNTNYRDGDDRPSLLLVDDDPVLADVLGAALGDVGEHVLLAVRHHRLGRLLRLDLLAADHQRNRDSLSLHLRQPDAQLLPLRRAGRVCVHRLVGGCGRPEDAGGAHCHRL